MGQGRDRCNDGAPSPVRWDAQSLLRSLTPAAGVSGLHHPPDLQVGQTVSLRQDSAAVPSHHLETKIVEWGAGSREEKRLPYAPSLQKSGIPVLLLPPKMPQVPPSYHKEEECPPIPHSATFSCWQLLVCGVIPFPSSSPEWAQGGQWGGGTGLLLLRR